MAETQTHKYGAKTGRARVSVRQVRYLDKLKDAKTESEAKKLAGYSPKTPTGKIMGALEKNASLQEALYDAGVTAEYIVDQYKKILEKEVARDSDKITILQTLNKIRGDFAPTETINKSVNFEAQIVEAASLFDNPDKSIIDINNEDSGQ